MVALIECRASKVTVVPVTVGRRGLGGAVLTGEVGADRPVEGVTVEGSEDASGGHRRRRAAPAQQTPAHPEGRQHAPAGPLTEPGDLLDASGAGDRRAGALQQNRRRRLPPPAP